MKLLISLLFLFGLVGCSSSKKDNRDLEERENEEIQREYSVNDASSKIRPGWIEDPEVWAKNHSKDMNKYRFFSYETGPKVSRNIACKLAKANVRADIASEIATFIDQQLAISQEGNSSVDENNPEVRALREFVENTLAEKIQALIHGAAVVKTYWEKRFYQKKKGAKKDFKAYTCGVFIRMGSERLAKAVERAAKMAEGSVDDPETKENVKNALSNASEGFNKSKRGQK